MRRGEVEHLLSAFSSVSGLLRRMRLKVSQSGAPTPFPLGFAFRMQSKPRLRVDSRVPAVSTPKQGWLGAPPQPPKRQSRPIVGYLSKITVSKKNLKKTPFFLLQGDSSRLDTWFLREIAVPRNQAVVFVPTGKASVHQKRASLAKST